MPTFIIAVAVTLLALASVLVCLAGCIGAAGAQRTTAPPGREPTRTGLPPRVAATAAYLLGPVTGLAFLLVEREHRFVRFHAAQALLHGLWFAGLAFLAFFPASVLLLMPPAGWIVAGLLVAAFAAGGLAHWTRLVMSAVRGREWEGLLLGDAVRWLAAPRRAVPEGFFAPASRPLQDRGVDWIK